MTDERIERLTLHGGQLRTITAGDGPPLVYLHGVGDNGAFLPVLGDLAERFRVIRPDHPGFLESDDFAVESVGDLAAVHRQALDALGIDRLTLIGCSLGGWTAVELALLVPERVEQLILIDPAGLAGDGTAPNVFELDPVSALEATVFDEDRRAAARANPREPTVAALLARNRATARRIAGDPYMHDPSLAARATRWAAEHPVPVHLVWGENDGVVPVSYLSAWRHVFPEARVTVIPRAGHLPHVERPQEFLEATGLLTSSGTGAPWN
ncbi:alpha/beta fold hydrolase [Herbiconiux daphne]|uniref:Alpha/beta fold hydrolase n=1 Tax=Herbiconiux daphne TaxID=2970914 RepID=A0ABT2H4D6_9MICO|nr:alpha/beta fold hydrolase [Herbiconiux daphne]MCS5734779.1 alpha/beta fold hydrolase [Herbiconiux daphne]